VRFLGHDRAGRFSVLCFDNRGLGRSDKPLARYTTSQMALDVADLVDHVGWTGDRAVHVVGISMGGMIAQELAAHVPARVASLTLVSTAAAAENVGAWHEMIGKRLTMLMPKSLAGNIEFTARQCFTQQWLDSPDDGDVPSPATTPRCKPSPAPGGEYGTFATNFQRFQALELHKRRDPGTWSNAGFACQLMAGATHKKTAEQLREIAERVGRDRIAVVHGTGDQIFDPGLARKLIDAMGPGEVQIIEGAGHAPVFENAAWFNPWLEGWLERVHGGSPS
jgi:pimeloyl-ACP methyl ester carboxylesterase